MVKKTKKVLATAIFILLAITKITYIWECFESMKDEISDLLDIYSRWQSKTKESQD